MNDNNNTNKPINSDETSIRRNRRKKKKAVEKIEVNLYINGVSYEYGVYCTFCTIRPAICHCKYCPDFYCNVCDITAHKTAKRKNHIREKISKYDLNKAALVITKAFRFNKHLKELQRRCRIIYKRYFDKNTLNHYYYNTKYNTVSWKKPYCLRKQELLPFLTEDQAANIIQGLYRSWIAREITRPLLIKYYRKIFDRTNGIFYYAFHGKSRLISRSNWKKPMLCNRRAFPKDIPLIYTEDVAAIIIQRKWRAILIRDLWRALARSSFEQLWDPLKGKWNYYDKDKSILLDKELKIMRGQPWDPNNVEEWSLERVSLFLRRIGLKHLVRQFIEYGVDGNTILMLDTEDYENMNINNKIERKRIEIEINRIFPHEKRLRVSEDIILKREKIRKYRIFTSAAIKIQRAYRNYLLRINKLIKLQKLKIQENELIIMNQIKFSQIWWSERDDIPSKLVSDGRHISNDESLNDHPNYRSSNNNNVILPPISNKTYGRKRDHMSSKGWGRRGPKGEWISLSNQSILDNKFPSIMDNHPTRIFTEKLLKSGYDKRRLQKFLGGHVDPFEYTIEYKKPHEIGVEL